MPFLHHRRTSLTLATTISLALDESKVRVCQSMLSSSRYIGVEDSAMSERLLEERPARDFSKNVQPMRSVPVSDEGRCRVEAVTGAS